jgi:hypothetical protein
MEERQNRDNLDHLRKHETIVDIDDLEQLESNSLLYGVDLEHKLQVTMAYNYIISLLYLIFFLYYSKKINLMKNQRELC